VTLPTIETPMPSLTAPAAPPEELDEYTVQVQRAKRFLGKNPRLPIDQLFAGTIVPLLDLIREEYLTGLDDLDARVDSAPVAGLTDDAKDLILAMSMVVDVALTKLEWVKEGVPTSNMPSEIASTYNEIKARIPAWMARYEAGDDDNDLDDDDEDGDEGDEPEVQAAAPTPAPVSTPVAPVSTPVAPVQGAPA
jgi:hypothetical protein